MLTSTRTLLVTAAATIAMCAYGYADARGGKGGGRPGASRPGSPHAHGHFRSHHKGYHRGYHRPGRVRSGGFFVAAPLFGWGYRSYGYALGPAPASPLYYIEKTDGYWYYCTETASYYPDVETCVSPWITVPGYQTFPAP